MQDIYVVGVGMTPFGKFRDKSIKDMTGDAVAAALSDAALAADRIDGAFFSNAVQGNMEGQHMIRGEIALRECHEALACPDVRAPQLGVGNVRHAVPRVWAVWLRPPLRADVNIV